MGRKALQVGTGNYKLISRIGFLPTQLIATMTVLDTGATLNVIRQDSIPGLSRVVIDRSYSRLRVYDANGQPLRIKGRVRLVVAVGSYVVSSSFLVVKSLSTSAILGCKFIDQHIAAILPSTRTVVLNDLSMVRIYRNIADILFPDDDRLMKSKSHSKPYRTIRLAKSVSIPPLSQISVLAKCKDAGAFFLQPSKSLYRELLLHVSPGIIEVKENRPFKVFVINYGSRTYVLSKNKSIGRAVTMSYEGIPQIQIPKG